MWEERYIVAGSVQTLPTPTGPTAPPRKRPQFLLGPLLPLLLLLPGWVACLPVDTMLVRTQQEQSPPNKSLDPSSDTYPDIPSTP